MYESGQILVLESDACPLICMNPDKFGDRKWRVSTHMYGFGQIWCFKV